MLGELQTQDKTVGLKQSIKKIRSGEAKKVFIALDAAPGLVEEISAACLAKNIPIVEVSEMKELGRAAGIDVGAAVVAVY
ncbi:MAG: ribosomal L7Ae/L30e/S12e/Gadd45 family protein [Clostridia bacterium]|nr:ribosomal L7Ae/L30e/S12e/Gadd45 family protein [Clostridia bacterium]